MSNQKNRPEKNIERDAMPRREFVRRLAATGVAIAGSAALGYKLWQPKHFVPGIGEKTSELPQLRKFNIERGSTDVLLAAAHGDDVEKMVRAAIAELGGIEKFIKKGDRVILKPNVAFDRPPKLGATTSPEVLAAVARLVKEAGASEIRILDNPINQPEGCFTKSGIRQAIAELANELPVKLVLPSESQFQTIRIDGPTLNNWPMFYKPFIDADKVIGIAPLKDHNLCHASMTMKNWYGLLGGQRNQFHQDIFGVITDLGMMMTPTLVILDATRILTRNGPTGGSMADVKPGHTVVAGVDHVAVDAFGAETLLKRDLDKIAYLKKAHDRGIGRMDWKQLNHREVTIS